MVQSPPAWPELPVKHRKMRGIMCNMVRSMAHCMVCSLMCSMVHSMDRSMVYSLACNTVYRTVHKSMRNTVHSMVRLLRPMVHRTVSRRLKPSKPAGIRTQAAFRPGPHP